MRIFVPSSGSREHAWGHKFWLDGHQVYTDAKANPGMRSVAMVVPGVNRDDPESLALCTKGEGFDFTLIGGETLLGKGVVDLFDSQGLPIVGPTRGAAMLETSKTFCYQLLRKARVLVPTTKIFDSYEAMVDYIRLRKPPFVVKFDGLAAGKGAKVVRTAADVEAAVVYYAQWKDKGQFQVQDFIDGKEVSFFVAADGYNARFLGTAADYKEHNGLMTGGMGGYAPNPLITPELHRLIMV